MFQCYAEGGGEKGQMWGICNFCIEQGNFGQSK